jgi:hypothetical protein
MRIMRNPYKGSYDELCAKVNETYKRTDDVRETVKETGLDFDAVWGHPKYSWSKSVEQH